MTFANFLGPPPERSSVPKKPPDQGLATGHGPSADSACWNSVFPNFLKASAV